MGTRTGERTREIVFKNFLGGIAWAAGASAGFAILAMVMGFVLNKLGGLPVIGSFLASLVEVTQTALRSRGILIR